MAAHAEAVSGPYSPEAWQPWREAAAAVQAAVTAFAKEPPQNRFEVEAALKKAVRHPEPDGS